MRFERRFPLTPALSLGEREPTWPVSLQAEAVGLFERLLTILPLPEGEGRGEGNAACVGLRGAKTEMRLFVLHFVLRFVLHLAGRDAAGKVLPCSPGCLR